MEHENAKRQIQDSKTTFLMTLVLLVHILKAENVHAVTIFRILESWLRHCPSALILRNKRLSNTVAPMLSSYQPQPPPTCQVLEPSLTALEKKRVTGDLIEA